MKNVMTRNFSIIVALSFLLVFTAMNAQAAIILPEDNSTISIYIYNSPSYPVYGQTVTLYASANGGTTTISQMNIYLDGATAKTCYPNSISASCNFASSTLAAGNHTYYATAKYGSTQNVMRDPLTGYKSFIVLPANDTTPPSVIVSHSPQNPVFGQNVTISASASDNSLVVYSIMLYVDGSFANGCFYSNSCAYTKIKPSIGNHTYYAVATDYAGNTKRDPLTGTKSFYVTNTTCTDSDGGINYYTKGNVTVCTFTNQSGSCGSATDICMGGILKEGYCENNQLKTVNYTCPYGCIDGKCNSTNQSYMAQSMKPGAFEMPTTSSVAWDVTPPFIYVYHVSQGDVTWIIANATDNAGLKVVSLYLNGTNVANCYPYSTFVSCQYSTYARSGTYYAFANDTSGNSAVDGPKSFSVAACTDTDSATYPTINYYAKGIVSYYAPNGSLVTVTDYCYGSALLEFYCKNASASMHDYSYFTCPNGCSDGKCNINTTDKTPPTVYVNATVSGNKTVTLKAIASDNVAILNIKINLDGSNVRTCALSPCIYSTSILSAGTHTYNAIATDKAGNVGVDPASGYKTFRIFSGGSIPIEASMPNSIIDSISSFLNKFFGKLA